MVNRAPWCPVTLPTAAITTLPWDWLFDVFVSRTMGCTQTLVWIMGRLSKLWDRNGFPILGAEFIGGAIHQFQNQRQRDMFGALSSTIDQQAWAYSTSKRPFYPPLIATCRSSKHGNCPWSWSHVFIGRYDIVSGHTSTERSMVMNHSKLCDNVYRG